MGGPRDREKELTIGRDIPESVVGTHRLFTLDDVTDGTSSDGCMIRLVGGVADREP